MTDAATLAPQIRDALHAKRYFDVAGHYGRTDVLSPP